MSEKLARAAGSVLKRGTPRRAFLKRTITIGSAVSIAPLRYLLEPVPASAITPGQCAAGARCTQNFTEFCCSVVGSNECPSYTYHGGYWKCSSYTGSSLCCAAGVRYYVDCNLRTFDGYTCNCVCALGSCDCRKTCCINFNYGNCNAQYAGRDDPIICRKIMCTNPASCYSVCSFTTYFDANTCGHESCTHCLNCSDPSPC